MDKELLISLYVDELLDEEEKKEVEASIDNDPEMKKLYQAMLLNKHAAFLESEAFANDMIAKIDQKELNAKILKQIPSIASGEKVDAQETGRVLTWITKYQQGLAFGFAAMILTLIAVKLVAFNERAVEYINGNHSILKIEHSTNSDEPTTIWILDDEEKKKSTEIQQNPQLKKEDQKDLKKIEAPKDQQP